jgi:hypothetical protein
LVLSLGAAAAYGAASLWFAWDRNGQWVVQDDARQHVFWMQRFLDPELFPQDWIADYFQSVAPPVYTGIYWVLSQVGLDPILASKLLPLVLGLVITWLCYRFTLACLPLPIAGVLASVLLNLSLWSRDDLNSGTPRALVYPLMLAVMVAWVERRGWGVALGMAGLAGVYPQAGVVALGALALGVVQWRDRRLCWSMDPRDWQLAAWGCGAGLLVLLPYGWRDSPFGPVVTLAEARSLPEFQEDARSPFFYADAGKFWLGGKSSSLLPLKWLRPVWTWAGLLWPIAALPGPRLGGRSLGESLRERLPLLAHGGDRAAAILTRFVLSAVAWYGLAFWVLFRLHLPGRYTVAVLRIAIAVAAGVMLPVLGDALARRVRRWRQDPAQRGLAVGGTAALGAIALLLVVHLGGFPWWRDDFPNRNYTTSALPQVYAFLRQQPKDTLIAVLAPEGDNIPTFAGRSVLASREYAIPYHRGYYETFRDRLNDLLVAQYSRDRTVVQNFIQRYGIDWWVLDLRSFEVDFVAGHEYKYSRWLRQFQPAQAEIVARLERGEQPVVQQAIGQCLVLQEAHIQILSAPCIAQRPTDIKSVQSSLSNQFPVQSSLSNQFPVQSIPRPINSWNPRAEKSPLNLDHSPNPLRGGNRKKSPF